MFLTITSLRKEETVISSVVSGNNTNYALVILSIILISISYNKKFNTTSKHEVKTFFFLKILLILICILTFCSEDKIVFFISFETSIIPMIIIVYLLRKRKEKIESAMYIFIIRISGSIPFLIYILKENNECLTMIIEITTIEQKKSMEIILSLMMIIIILVKIPLFFLHV